MLEEFSEGVSPWPGGWISSPYHLHCVERQRRATVPGPVVETDLFLWGRGEPKDRMLTKVGGLPYWPMDRAWPVFGDQPMVFLGQFNFADSLDLTGKLPGELLLLFSTPDFSWLKGDRAGLVMRWMNRIEGRLVVEKMLPKAEPPFFKGYGVIHRTADPAEGRVTEGGGGGFGILNGTKIGGMASGAGRWKPGCRFLAQLGSIGATAGVGYPWVNQPRPLGETSDASGIHWEQNRLSLGGGGGLRLYLDGAGEVRWDIAVLE